MTDPAIAEQLAELRARHEGLAIAQAMTTETLAQLSDSTASLIESLQRQLSALEARVVLMEKLLEELEIDTSGGEH